jgi:hypothetical protein
LALPFQAGASWYRLYFWCLLPSTTLKWINIKPVPKNSKSSLFVSQHN